MDAPRDLNHDSSRLGAASPKRTSIAACVCTSMRTDGWSPGRAPNVSAHADLVGRSCVNRSNREVNRDIPRNRLHLADWADGSADKTPGHSTAQHLANDWEATLNPQVLGSNPRGRTTNMQVKAARATRFGLSLSCWRLTWRQSR